MLFLEGKGRAYEEEIEGMIGRAAKEFPVFEEASWFLELVRRRLCGFPSGKKNVFVMGNNLPDEMFRMFGITPVRLLGGSRILAGISDSDLPRDTDPVARMYLFSIDGQPVFMPYIQDGETEKEIAAYWQEESGYRLYRLSGSGVYRPK